MNNQVKKISIGNEDFREKTTTTKNKKTKTKTFILIWKKNLC